MVVFQTSMIINQSTEWKPRTYYILENIQSGKKYIGQTVQDITHYLGSGAYWIPHCKKHGGYNRDNISIVHSKLYESKEDAQQYLDEFKKTNVDYWQTSNKEWANLCEENTEDSPLTGGEITRRVNAKRVADGTHNLLGGENVRKQVADGTHHWLGPENNNKRVADGTHPFLGPENSRRRMEDGTHNCLETHICPHCNKEGKGPVMHRFHFDKCKLRNWSNIFDE